MNTLNFDLQLQLVNYLYRNNIIAFSRLLQINLFFYTEYLYVLRKQRYILTVYEIYELNRVSIHKPAHIDLIVNNEAFNGRLLLVKYLNPKKINIYAIEDFALQRASTAGHLDVVKYLVSVGSDVNAHNDWALVLAAENGHSKVVKYLIKNGANVNVLTSEQRQKYAI